MCDAIAELVEVLDFRSARFLSALRFLEELEPERFDCLVSDVRMPGMDGFELGRRASAIAPGLPIIFVSSFDDEVTRSQAARVGAAAFLCKPVDADALLENLNAALDRG